MPPEAITLPNAGGATVHDRVAALNARFRHHGATDVMRAVLRDGVAGRIAMVSSFGAESVALLHLVAMADRTTPVLFLDTRLLFPETLDYQRQVADRLGLRDVRVLRANPDTLARRDPYGALRHSDPDACCTLRKAGPLEAALSGFDGWITGRKRYQSAGRATLDFFEAETATGRIKVNPLAHWAPGDTLAYIEENRLPRHPLVAQGYPSIGCAPCTSRVADGEDPRAGRWRGQDKNECGIHFVNGKAVRSPAVAEAGPTDEGKTMRVIVADRGFSPDDWQGPVLDIAPDTDPDALSAPEAGTLVRIAFPAFSDGRGFTLARLLRLRGFTGRLRAAGHVIADQYAMARRAGFDEVEIDADLAARQPEAQWRARADWRSNDYQARMRG